MASSSYDALNRVTQVAYGDQTITYGYDLGTNGVGRLTSAADANHSMSWSYDGQGRVTDKSQTVGSVTKAVSYGYTSGNLTSLTTPSGQSVLYSYNSNHQLTDVAVNGTTVLSSVLYDPFGPVRGWTWGNSTLAVRTYDSDGKITQVDSAGLKTYGYDDAFRMTGVTDTVDSALSWSYAYDLLDRLTSGSKSGLNQSFTYDANGNRLTQGGTSSTTFTVSSTSNRLSSTSGALSRTYAYDAAGNTTSYGSLTFTYNNAGRMKTSVTGGVTTTYLYNALGQRVKKSGGAAGTVLYWYDEAGHLLGEYDGSGNLIEETIWLGDIPVATLRPGSPVAIYYVHTDHLNTPRKVSRPSDDALLWRWDSDPFGTTAPNENPESIGTFTYKLRMPGQYFDVESGLSYNYFRDYDPAIGRYVESDPIGLEGDVGTYNYADEAPQASIDPLGLKTEVCCRYLNSFAGVMVYRGRLTGLGQRHCFLSVDGTTYSLFPDGDVGRPSINRDEDRKASKWTMRCKECKPRPRVCTSLAECIQKAHDSYPIGYYFPLGPNSNTYAGTLARSCCDGGMPPGLGSAPGINTEPPGPPVTFMGDWK